MLCMQELLSKLGGAGQLLASYTSLPPHLLILKATADIFIFVKKKKHQI